MFIHVWDYTTKTNSAGITAKSFAAEQMFLLVDPSQMNLVRDWESSFAIPYPQLFAGLPRYSMFLNLSINVHKVLSPSNCLTSLLTVLLKMKLRVSQIGHHSTETSILVLRFETEHRSQTSVT